MIRIDIESTEVRTKSGISQRTSKPYSIREQTAHYFRQGEKYPDRITVTLGDGQPPYAVGTYTLHPSSYFVNRYGQLQVQPVLAPVVKQASA